MNLVFILAGIAAAVYGASKVFGGSAPAPKPATPASFQMSPITIPAEAKCVLMASRKSWFDPAFDAKKIAVSQIAGTTVYIRKTGQTFLLGTKSAYEGEEIWVCPPGQKPPSLEPIL